MARSFVHGADRRRASALAIAQDHKRVFDNDRGPNTGGMGAYSPAPVVTPAIHRRIMDEVLTPLLAG
jgi:phosphoribosylamine--glycine ligase